MGQTVRSVAQFSRSASFPATVRRAEQRGRRGCGGWGSCTLAVLRRRSLLLTALSVEDSASRLAPSGVQAAGLGPPVSLSVAWTALSVTRPAGSGGSGIAAALAEAEGLSGVSEASSFDPS